MLESDFEYLINYAKTHKIDYTDYNNSLEAQYLTDYSVIIGVTVITLLAKSDNLEKLAFNAIKKISEKDYYYMIAYFNKITEKISKAKLDKPNLLNKHKFYNEITWFRYVFYYNYYFDSKSINLYNIKFFVLALEQITRYFETLYNIHKERN